MTEKIIIENRSSLDTSFILPYVGTVIAKGRISNNGTQYSLMTDFKTMKGDIVVWTDNAQRCDRFVIEDNT